MKNLPTLKSVPGVTWEVAVEFNKRSKKPIYAFSDPSNEVISVAGFEDLEARVLAHRDKMNAVLSERRVYFQPLLSIPCVTTKEILQGGGGERESRPAIVTSIADSASKVTKNEMKRHLTVVK